MNSASHLSQSPNNQSQTNDSSVLERRYCGLVTDKPHETSQGRIAYDWSSAQRSHIQLVGTQDKQKLLKEMIELQLTYMERMVPASYSHYAISSILKTATQPLESLQAEKEKVLRGESTYQQIAVHLTLREQLTAQILSEQKDGNKIKALIDKYQENMTLVVMKIDQWQKTISGVIGYPVFFVWNGFHALVNPQDPRLTQHLKKVTSLRFLPDPNPLFLTFDWKDVQNHVELIETCLTILKQQKARELQLALQPPPYATTRNQKKAEQKIQQSPQPKAKQTRVRSRNASLVTAKKEKPITTETALPQEQLQVLRKFRSLGKVRKGSALAPPVRRKTENNQQLDKGIRGKLDALRSQVEKRPSSKIQPVSKQQIGSLGSFKVKKSSSIRIVLEKEVNLLDTPMKGSKVVAPPSLIKSPPRSQRTGNEKPDKMAMLQKETQLLIDTRKAQKQELSHKAESLSQIKQNLVSKIQVQQQQARKKQTKPVSSVFSAAAARALEAGNEKDRLEGEKKALVRQKEDLIELQKKREDSASKARRKLEQRHEEGERLRADLLAKKMRIEAATQGDGRNKGEEEQQLMREVDRMKAKRTLQVQSQKRRMGDLEANLKEQLKLEQVRHEELNQKEAERQKRAQEEYDRKVEVLQRQFTDDLARIQETIKQEEERKKEYESQLALQNQRTAQMEAELKEWEERERSMLDELERAQREREARRAAEQRKRQEVLEGELRKMQEGEKAVLGGYRESNRQLNDMLQQLRDKNRALEAKVGPV